MGIADIIAEQQASGVSGATPGEPRSQPQQPQPNRQPTNQRRPNAPAINLGSMSRDEALFWMQVIQTVALVYIAMKLT